MFPFPPEFKAHEECLLMIHKRHIKSYIEETLRTRIDFASFTKSVIHYINSLSVRESLHPEMTYLGAKVCFMVGDYKTLSEIESDHPGALVWKTWADWRLGNLSELKKLEEIKTDDKNILLENLALRIEATTASDVKAGYPLFNEAEMLLGSKVSANTDPALLRPFLLCMAAFGKVMYLDREHKHATQLLEKGLDQARRLKDQYCEALLLHTLALVTEESEKILKLLDRAIRIRRNIGDKGGLVGSINNKAIVYHERGALAQALQLYSQCLAIEEEMGNKSGKAGSLNNIGIIYHTWGKLDQAEDYYRRTTELGEEMGDYEIQGIGFMNLAELQEEQGNYEKALEYLHESDKRWAEIGLGGNIEINLAFCNVLTKMNELTRAREYIEEAEKQVLEKGTELDKVWTNFYRGQLEKYAENLDNAKEIFLALVEQAEKAEVFEALLNSYLNLAEILVKKFETNLNEEYLNQAQDYIRKTSMEANKANVQQIYVKSRIIEGILLAAIFEFENAINALEQAFQLAKSNNFEKLTKESTEMLNRTKKQMEDSRISEMAEINKDDAQLKLIREENLRNATKYLKETTILVSRLLE
ncbi:MAG: tetratricopeptide repeat protein, partial [Candidatus Hodarchaeota archaeon]